jgi:hypothetical protein
VNRLVLLGVLERLLAGQGRVLEQDREDDQRNAQADTDNAEDPLNVLIGVVHGLSRSSADRVGNDPGVRRSIDFLGEGDISNRLFNLLGKDLGPNGTGNSGAERGTDVVGRQVETWREKALKSVLFMLEWTIQRTSDNCDILMLCLRLNGCLRRITGKKAQTTLSAMIANRFALSFNSRYLREQTARDTEDDFSTDDTGIG